MKQSEDCITLHRQNYIEEIELLSVDRKKEKNELLSDEEFKGLRAVVGQLLWVSGQTRPNISFDTCQLSSSLKIAAVEDQLGANKTIKKLKPNEVKSRFPSMDKWKVEKAQLVSFSDASLANLKNGGSQGGGIIFIVGENGEYAPLSWNFKKIKQMVKRKYHYSRNACFVRRIRKLLLVRFHRQGDVRCGWLFISFSNSSTDSKSIIVQCCALNKNNRR